MNLEIHPSVIRGYGLIDASFDRTTETFGSHQRADQSTTSVLRISSEPADGLEYLGMRTVPETRLVLIDMDGWTGVLTNHRSGSDFNNLQFWAGRSVGVRTLRVVDSEARWWRRGQMRERLSYEARIFELHSADDVVIRSIACADDGGRWIFETNGQPLAAEASFDYSAPRKKDRFTRSNLHDLLISVGPGPLTAERFLGATRIALLAEWITDARWRRAVDERACSLEQADDPAHGYMERGMGFAAHMSTHATSVINDLERAIEINPSYEPIVREYLRQAYRVVAKQR